LFVSLTADTDSLSAYNDDKQQPSQGAKAGFYLVISIIITTIIIRSSSS